MDFQLEFISNQINLKYTALKIKYSLDEIKKSNPHRTALIQSMSDSKNDVENAQDFLRAIETEYKMSTKRCYDLELINLQLIKELEDLKKVNVALFKDATL